MARPLVLISNILAWLLGVSIAFGTGESIELTPLGLGFSAMMLVSVSVHYVNEYADHQTDALTTQHFILEEVAFYQTEVYDESWYYKQH